MHRRLYTDCEQTETQPVLPHQLHIGVLLVFYEITKFLRNAWKTVICLKKFYDD